MNNPEDYASDTDDSDCDFDPKAHDSHVESEEDEDDVLDKKNSRKKIPDEPKTTVGKEDLPEVDTKKADDLWASFMDDNNKEPAASNKSNGSSTASPATTSSNSAKKPVAQLPQRKPPTFLSSLKRPATGGLGNILGQLGKKNKLSVLEQSKQDWNSFKDEEGLNEELQTFNKGKDG